EIAREGDRAGDQAGAGGPGALLDVVESAAAARGEETIGTVHHVAWRATDDAHEVAWRERLVAAGRQLTPVIDRKYFQSIYFREPGGVLFEVATDGPGFTVDETPEALGTGLQLPPHAEANRDQLKFNLPPIAVPNGHQTAAKLTPGGIA
ncbi:MAG: VOC family protein, partial [Chloroflexota bacterium]